jgi:hypothetical protein
MSGPIKSQVASSTPFNNSTNGFTAIDVQAAIEEVNNNASSKGRYVICAGFDGNASSGRFLEFNSNVDSDKAGYVVVRNCILREISLVCESNATFTVTIQKRSGPTTVTTASLTSSRAGITTGLSAAMSANDEIQVKVTSGSCARPICWLSVEPD